VLIIVLQFVDDNWDIQQRVARLMLLAKSLTGEELARQLIVCLSTELGMTAKMIPASMGDRASVNTAAMSTVKIVFPDIGCFPHTLDHVGDHMKTPVLDKFMKGWIGLKSENQAGLVNINWFVASILFNH
jgi:hypothetical protein